MRTNLRTPRTLPLRDAQGMFFGWLLGGGAAGWGSGHAPAPGLGTSPPWAGQGSGGTLTYHFHGNPQRRWADLLCSGLLSLGPVFMVPCPLQPPSHPPHGHALLMEGLLRCCHVPALSP